MAERVVLHVGTMKSGTTYLQDVLTGGGLDGTDAFYPGGTFGAQTRAVRRLLRPDGERDPAPWAEVAAEARHRAGVAVVSQEFLGFAGRARIDDVVRSFGDAAVEVLVTVRDQHAALPAQWQSYTRNQGTDDFAGYLRRLHRGLGADGDAPERDSKAVRSFRRAQDVPGVLRRWARADVARVTVVVVPPPGPDPTALWRRFCAAARIDAADAPQAQRRSNESLGYASCDVLRRVNAALGPAAGVAAGAVPQPRYKRLRGDVVEALLPLRPQEGRPVLDRAGAALARRLNDDVAAAVGRPGVDLVGDPAELPGADAAPATDPPDTVAPPDPGEVARAADVVCRAVTGAPAPDDLDTAVALVAAHLASPGSGGS